MDTPAKAFPINVFGQALGVVGKDRKKMGCWKKVWHGREGRACGTHSLVAKILPAPPFIITDDKTPTGKGLFLYAIQHRDLLVACFYTRESHHTFADFS